MVEELPIIDLKLGAKILGGNEQQAKEMVEALVSLLPQNLKDLQEAYLLKDREKLSKLAHYLHGGACYCGTPRLKTVAKELEIKASRSQSAEELQIAYEQLCEEIKAVIVAWK